MSEGSDQCFAPNGSCRYPQAVGSSVGVVRLASVTVASLMLYQYFALPVPLSAIRFPLSMLEIACSVLHVFDVNKAEARSHTPCSFFLLWKWKGSLKMVVHIMSAYMIDGRIMHLANLQIQMDVRQDASSETF